MLKFGGIRYGQTIHSGLIMEVTINGEENRKGSCSVSIDIEYAVCKRSWAVSVRGVQ